MVSPLENLVCGMAALEFFWGGSPTAYARCSTAVEPFNALRYTAAVQLLLVVNGRPCSLYCRSIHTNGGQQCPPVRLCASATLM